jgi:tRNA (guanosine-2'-O-)-methyltransferase
MKSDRRNQKLQSVLSYRQPDLTIVMENIHDPHNVSAMLRSADAVGINEVQLVYTEEEFPKIGKKSSSSASKWVERRRFRSITACYDKLRDEGFMVYATRLDQQAKSLFSLDLTRKVAIVFGNEHAGVSDEAAEKADASIMIPMMGMIQSLNVSVACAVVVYEVMRQRLSAGDYKSSKFSEREFTKRLSDWMEK